MSEKTIGALSRFTGISAHTIKYYEKIGLLSVGRKENSNYRSYDMRVCTDIYECVKYRNMGFSLKDTQELVKEASNERVNELLAERKAQIEEEITRLTEQRRQLEIFQEQIGELERHLGKWYVEECRDFYLRPQTKELDFDEDYCLESGGLNLAEYMPISQSTVWLKEEYLAGGLTGYSWGQGVFPAERKDRIHGREGYLHVPAGRAFVTYMKFAGPYVSDGRMGQELMKVYRQFRQDTPKEAFGQRIRITRDGDGTVWNYFKVFIPLAEE